MATDLDDVAKDDQGLLASRPTSTPGSPGKFGRFYYATDSKVLYRDYGTGWLAIGPTTGDLKATALALAPEGWLLCDGSAVSRATYAALFAAISTAYGAGDGSTTFNLPDLRGRVPVGEDGAAGRMTANDARGQSGGEEKHLNSSAESGMPTHTHADTLAVASAQPWTAGWNAPFSNSSWVRADVNAFAGSGVNALAQASSGTVSYTGGAHSHTLTGAVSSAAGVAASAAHNNMPPYQVVNWLIHI